MSFDCLSVWLAHEVDVRKTLSDLGWSVSGDDMVKLGREWHARTVGSRPVFAEDVPSGVIELLPNVSWVVELSNEGNAAASDKALLRAASRIARTGCGVISDGISVWFPGKARAVQGASSDVVTSSPALLMSWFARGGPLTTGDGLSELFNTLERLIPEVIPDRWDVVEPPSHRLEVDGIEGLIVFVIDHHNEFLSFWTKAPTRSFELHTSPWGGPFGSFLPVTLRITLDASVLDEEKWNRRLPLVFSEISKVVRPFYGEARLASPFALIQPDDDSPLPTTYLGGWCGVPTMPAFAIAVGSPYLEQWPEAGQGYHVAGLSVVSSNTWTLENSRVTPIPPATISAKLTKDDRRAHWDAERPPFWPFDEARHGGHWELELISPLHQAAQANRASTIDSMLAEGGDPNIEDTHRRTPLYWAAVTGSVQAAESLLKHNADVDSQNDSGESPLYAAVSSLGGSLELIALLLRYGASAHLTTNDGDTPMACASRRLNPELLALFEDLP